MPQRRHRSRGDRVPAAVGRDRETAWRRAGAHRSRRPRLTPPGAAVSVRDLARAEELAKRGFLPRAQLEEARTRVSTGQASLAQARGQARSAQAMLAETGAATSGAPVPVRAPASGSVMSVINESEGVIPEGTPLMTIGDPHRIEVVVDLLSREAVRVKPGRKRR